MRKSRKLRMAMDRTLYRLRNLVVAFRSRFQLKRLAEI